MVTIAGEHFEFDILSVTPRGTSIKLPGRGRPATQPWFKTRMIRTADADYTLVAGKIVKRLPEPGELRLVVPQAATVTLSNQRTASGRLLSLEADQIAFQPAGQPFGIAYPAKNLKEVRFGAETWVYNSAAGVLTKQEAVVPPVPSRDSGKVPPPNPVKDPPKEGTGPGADPFKPHLIVLVFKNGQQRIGTGLGLNQQGVLFKGTGTVVPVAVPWQELRAIRDDKVEYTLQVGGKINVRPHSDNAAHVLGPKTATITRTDGKQVKGILVSLVGGELGFRDDSMAAPMTFTAKDVREVKTDDETYTLDGALFLTKALERVQQARAAQAKMWNTCFLWVGGILGGLLLLKGIHGKKCPYCGKWRAGRHVGKEVVERWSRTSVSTNAYGAVVNSSTTTYRKELDHYRCRFDPQHTWAKGPFEVTEGSIVSALLSLFVR